MSRCCERSFLFPYLLCLAVSAAAGGLPAQALAKVADLSWLATGIWPHGDPARLGDALYFTCSQGGFYGHGTLCRHDLLSGTTAKVADLYGPVTGSYPSSEPLAVGSDLYFTCGAGGALDAGTLCRFSTATGQVVKLADVDPQTMGANPVGGLARVGDEIYFLTLLGLTGGALVRHHLLTGGTVVDAVLTASTGFNPQDGPVASGNEVYFTCANGGGFDGTLVRRTAPGTLNVILSLGNQLSIRPFGKPAIVPSGIYFTCTQSGPTGWGGLVRWQPATGGTIVAAMDCPLGRTPSGGVSALGSALYFIVPSANCQSCLGTSGGAIVRHEVGGATTLAATLTCPLFISPSSPASLQLNTGLTPVGQDLWFLTTGGGIHGGGTLGRFTPQGGAQAAVATLGNSCGAGPNVPALGATNPVIGQSFATVLGGADPGRPGGLFVSFPGAAPVPIGGGCTLWVDPANPGLLAPFLTSALGTWSLSLPVPPDIGFVGVRYRLQAAVLDAAAPLGVDITNGLELTLGY